MQVITIHNDTGYAITLNAATENASTAGDAFVELVDSWTWTD